MFSKNIVSACLFFSGAFVIQNAQAAPLAFNVDGVISDATNTPVEAASVAFQIDVKNPANDCLLYRENFTVVMTGSGGYFSIVLGKQSNAVSGGVTLEKVFSNQAVAIPGSPACTFTPATTSDTRKIIVAFNDGSGAQTFSTQEVQAVPYALEAVQASKVGLFGPTDLLRASTSVSQTTNTNSALTQTQYDEFWRLVKNPSTAYGNVNSITASAPISVGGTAAIPDISMTAASTTSNGYLTSADWNAFNAKMPATLATSNIWIGNAGNGPQARTISGDATIGPTGALTLANTIGSSATVGSVSAIPVITYDAKGRITAMSSAVPSDPNKVPLSGGTMSGNLVMGGNLITGLTNVPNVGAIPNAGNDGKSLRWNNGGGTWDWFTPAAGGIAAFNSQTGTTQSFGAIDLGTTVLTPTWSSASDVHTLKIPMAADTGVTAGLISKTQYDRIGKVESLNGKTFNATAASAMGQITFFDSAADKWKVSTATAPADGEVLKWDNTAKSWKPGTDSGGWTAVDASYATKGIVQFDTNASTSAISVTSGVASVSRSTLGTANSIVALDGSSVGTMSGLSLTNATFNVTLQAANVPSASYALRFPAAQGSNGQIMKNDGTGNLSWVTPASGLPAASGSASSPAYAFSGATSTGMFGVATNDIGFSSGGLEKVRITSSGNLGIATTSPETTLDVNGPVTMRQAYYESIGALGTYSTCGVYNISGFTTNQYELTACPAGTTTMNIPTITSWPSGNMTWNVTFYVTGQTGSVFNVSYNNSTTAVYWDRNSTGTLGGNGFAGFPVNSGSTNVISCTVVNTSAVKVYCGVSAQY